MKLDGSWQRALIGLLVFLMAVPAPVFAQNNVPVFRQEELDQILAPIALYPDSLLAQILMASTYPLEVVQADRWVKQNRNLPPEALNDALDRQRWEPSVKALVPFPDVLSMMSQRLDWTQSVGDAFLAQEADVMATIQELRARAYEAGNLHSNQQVTVSREASVIVIEPANPRVVYVPAYNPVVVYGRWWYPAYPPVVIYPYPPGAAIATGIIFFGVGYAVASAWNHGWGHCDWGHRNVYVNVNRTVNINRTTTVINTREIRTTTWHHDPGHRKGVAYRDPGTRDKFAPANRQAVDNRRDYRGYVQTAPARPATAAVSKPGPDTRPGPAVARPTPEAKPAPGIAKPAPDTKPGPGAVARPSPQARPAPTITQPTPEAKPAPGIAKPAQDTKPGPGAVARPSPQARPAPTATQPTPETKPGPVVIQQPSPQTRPAPEKKPGPAAVERPPAQARPAQTISRPAPSNTIYGVEQGSKARKESARGRESLTSSKGRESSQPSHEAPQTAPAKQQSPAQGGARQGGGAPAHR